MSVTATLRAKLAAAFAPARLEIDDESDRHRGHAGARPGGESHFRVLIVSEAFRGLPRLARQRAVNAALKEELAGPVHALSARLLSPEEAAAEDAAP